MQALKKRRIPVVTIVIIICFVVFLGVHFYNNYIRIQNVFDQMYYTRVHTYFNWWNPGDFRGDFINMEQLEIVDRKAEDGYTSEGWFCEYYKSECLAPNTGLDIEFFFKSYIEPNKLTITYYVGTGGDEVPSSYRYEYDLSSRILSYSTTDPEDTENKKFLYDIFLKDWFEANPNTRFSLDELGNFTRMDESDQ